MLDPRTPVLVGVGTCFADAEAVDLMTEATAAAGNDAGAPDLLRAVERIAVPRGTWSYTDPARIVATRIGAPDATTVLVDLGIPQQTLIDDAMAAMLAGEIEVAVVVGAEAKARAARAEHGQRTRADRAGVADVVAAGRTPADASEIDQSGARPDVHQQPTGDIVDPTEIEAGLWAPVEQYALIESALCAADGVRASEMGEEVSQLWARFNQIARRNSNAAFPEPMSADQLCTFSPGNRPLAFPYAKWHASQWTVDQGAALLLCTTAAADRFGVPADRRVHPLVGVSSSHAVPLTRRREPGRWPAMGVLGAAAAERLGHPVADCDLIDLYSCFPSAVRVQQRELGLDPGGTPTVTGGMAFAGGPFNNYVLQAFATVVGGLRESGGRALVTSVSGLLTKPGLGVWSSEPDGRPPLVADLAAEAASATATVPVVSSHEGEATVVASTVTFDRLEPVEVVALLDVAEGGRVIARSRDAGLVERAMGPGLVGASLIVDGNVATA